MQWRLLETSRDQWGQYRDHQTPVEHQWSLLEIIGDHWTPIETAREYSMETPQVTSGDRYSPI